jgi:hypothetical protein
MLVGLVGADAFAAAGIDGFYHPRVVQLFLGCPAMGQS